MLNLSRPITYCFMLSHWVVYLYLTKTVNTALYYCCLIHIHSNKQRFIPQHMYWHLSSRFCKILPVNKEDRWPNKTKLHPWQRQKCSALFWTCTSICSNDWLIWILQAQNTACSCGESHAKYFTIHSCIHKRNLLLCLTWPRHIKLSLRKAFCAAFVSVFGDVQQQQHYINKVSHMKKHQQGANKKVNFGKCEEIPVKTQHTHYLHVLTTMSLSTDVITQFPCTRAADSMRWTL